MYNTSMLNSAKLVKEDLNKWRDIITPMKWRVNILKISILSKSIYGVMAILNSQKKKKKIKKAEKLILKFLRKWKEQRLVKAIMKMHKVEDLDLLGTGLL